MTNFNYMDNVPVKISENYRPLPIVYQLPQTIAHKLALPEDHYQTAHQYKYDFQLEHILLQKLPEWRHVRQREKEARRQRMQNRVQQKQRMYEVQQKELLGAVSYPSTEDLSSCSSDEGEKKESKVATANKTTKQGTIQNNVSQAGVNNFHNILQPTILAPSAINSSVPANGGYIPILSSSLNYQDFEGSSSPFDEIELKTINDLDILAQVLHNTQIKQLIDKKNDDEGTEKDADSPEIEANRKESVDTTVENIPNSTVCKADIISSHLPLNTHMNSESSTTTLYTQPPYHHAYSMQYTKDFIPCTYYSNSNQASYQSKSVPDILNIVKEETRKSERINRIRNYSEVLVEEEEAQPINKISNVDIIASPLYYNKLDEKSKQMVKNISTMGFSLEQASRIALLYGADNKKIVEHLISLNELIVLGFDEENITNALLKCENNKEKALELLIS